MKSDIKALGSIAQYINKQLHTEPFSFLFHGCFWFCFLTIICPISAVISITQSLYRSIEYMFSYLNPKHINAKENESILAVFITGCDSGFGKDLAVALAEQGFVVFAACLTTKGMLQYSNLDDDGTDNSSSKIIPVLVDVTNDGQVREAANIVTKWLESDDPSTPRVLHAVVNNAGVGTPGFVDFLEMSSYEFDMEVNYFGMIRTTKAFLPILKKQACAGSHRKARIINIISTAGLVAIPSMSAYNSSKFAAEAFSSCLRLEIQSTFGIQVVTVNPTFHGTPIVDGIGKGFELVWNKMSSGKQQEYGMAFYNRSMQGLLFASQALMWNADIVRDQLVACIQTLNPSPQLLIGSDGKYFYPIFRILPIWVHCKLFEFLGYFMVKPAMLSMKNES